MWIITKSEHPTAQSWRIDDWGGSVPESRRMNEEMSNEEQPS
jgi:hypothetical protein